MLKKSPFKREQHLLQNSGYVKSKRELFDPVLGIDPRMLIDLQTGRRWPFALNIDLRVLIDFIWKIAGFP